MIYLIADTSRFEWPLATAGSLNELAKMCNTTVNHISVIICRGRATKLFNGRPAMIYKFQEEMET
ncbi:hypothetical protein ACWI_36150 [Acetobacterium wieringae]|uniref:Uncharacterized protein n=1 Tax=Acetobacterium wieringae TaxID=52694 RepID=A0A1F2PD22_9FIRM|nr:hypothetical protein ACWI_36150 [Acetobacterium wieringae]